MAMPRLTPQCPIWVRLAAVAALGSSLAACADRVVTGPTYPVDVRERHPIVLADAPRTLDVFVNSATGLDSRQRDDVRAFAGEYRRYGQGQIIALSRRFLRKRPTSSGRAAVWRRSAAH
jgi:type IV pilus biogenesis protein CpaD/CtpE